MPYLKSPLSLDELSTNIVINLIMNCEQVQRQLRNLPVTLIQHLYQRLCQLKRANLYSNIFIRRETKSIRDLNLFDLPMEPLLDKIGQVCKNLTDLSFNPYKLPRGVVLDIPPASMIKLLDRVPQLRSLDLCHYKQCTNEVLAEIGRKCPQLRVLSIVFCVNVTDVGLRSLSYCKKLESLNFAMTNVTAEGAFYIFKQLPSLKVFKTSLWDDVFQMLREEFYSNTTLQTYSIVETCERVGNNDDLTILTTIFPNLCSLTVWNSNVVLKRNLTQQLTNLRLYYVGLADIEFIDHQCPALKSLSLDSCDISNTPYLQESAEYFPFMNLEELSILCRNDTDIVVNEFLLLLVKCKNLKRLRLSCCQLFTDNLITDIVRLNGFENL
uniref:F-box domain-containing protein n=1 Tax=Strigamia maritima TaxID=126957 RepID=T1IR93_STRMM